MPLRRPLHGPTPDHNARHHLPLLFPLDGEDPTTTETTLETIPRIAEAERRHRRRTALASGPDAYARLSREKILHCERVRARRSALPCPPTTDLGHDETVRRDHELDLHRLRQTEYRGHRRLHHSNHTSRISPPLNDHMQVNVPRERAPSNLCLSSPRFRTDRDRLCRSHSSWLLQPHTQSVIVQLGHFLPG